MRDEREAVLTELVPQVEFIGDPLWWWKVKTSSTSTYRSQGYGMHGYAKGALNPMRDWLKQLGFATSVRWKLHFKGEGPYNCGDGGDYQLWANCPEWMADVAERTLTWETASKAMYPLNPKVYNPFLSNERFDEHYAQGGAK